MWPTTRRWPGAAGSELPATQRRLLRAPMCCRRRSTCRCDPGRRTRRSRRASRRMPSPAGRCLPSALEASIQARPFASRGRVLVARSRSPRCRRTGRSQYPRSRRRCPRSRCRPAMGRRAQTTPRFRTGMHPHCRRPAAIHPSARRSLSAPSRIRVPGRAGSRSSHFRSMPRRHSDRRRRCRPRGPRLHATGRSPSQAHRDWVACGRGSAGSI